MCLWWVIRVWRRVTFYIQDPTQILSIVVYSISIYTETYRIYFSLIYIVYILYFIFNQNTFFFSLIILSNSCNIIYLYNLKYTIIIIYNIIRKTIETDVVKTKILKICRIFDSLVLKIFFYAFHSIFNKLTGSQIQFLDFKCKLTYYFLFFSLG